MRPPARNHDAPHYRGRPPPPRQRIARSYCAAAILRSDLGKCKPRGCRVAAACCWVRPYTGMRVCPTIAPVPLRSTLRLCRVPRTMGERGSCALWWCWNSRRSRVELSRRVCVLHPSASRRMGHGLRSRATHTRRNVGTHPDSAVRVRNDLLVLRWIMLNGLFVTELGSRME